MLRCESIVLCSCRASFLYTFVEGVACLCYTWLVGVHSLVCNMSWRCSSIKYQAPPSPLICRHIRRDHIFRLLSLACLCWCLTPPSFAYVSFARMEPKFFRFRSSQIVCLRNTAGTTSLKSEYISCESKPATVPPIFELESGDCHEIPKIKIKTAGIGEFPG